MGCGPGDYSEAEDARGAGGDGTTLTIDSFGIASAMVRGLLHFTFGAQNVTLRPRLPDGLRSVRQKHPIHWGSGLLFVSMARGPVTAVSINGTACVACVLPDGERVVLPWSAVFENAATAVTIIVPSTGPAEEIETTEDGAESLAEWSRDEAARQMFQAALLPAACRPNITTLARGAKVTRFRAAMAGAGLGRRFEAAQAGAVLAALNSSATRCVGRRDGSIKPLPEQPETWTAAKYDIRYNQSNVEAYFDDVVGRIWRGLGSVIASYDRSNASPEESAVLALWREEDSTAAVSMTLRQELKAEMVLDEQIVEARARLESLLLLKKIRTPVKSDDIAANPMGAMLPPRSWATYNMTLSTVTQPCDYSGYFNTSSVGARFGIVSFDWQNGKNEWANQQPMDCEERLVEQARRQKAAHPHSKAGVYRNLVKALPWFSSVRKKLADPRYSGFFIPFSPAANHSVPECDTNYRPPRCSDRYHDQSQCPQHPAGANGCRGEGCGSCIDAPCDCGGVPCGEYLFDHRNGSMLTNWIVNEYIGGKNGVDNESIDFMFIDDGWIVKPTEYAPNGRGPSEENRNALLDTGLSPAETLKMCDAWHNNVQQAHRKIVASKAYSWQLFNCGPSITNDTYTWENAQFQCDCNTNFSAPGRDLTNPRAKCTEWMREYCVPPAGAKQGRLESIALFFGFTMDSLSSVLNRNHAFPAFMQDLASFLMVRGPFAWLGYPWIDCGYDGYLRPPELDVDYGSPTGQCEEVGTTGVFKREWSKALVEVDCGAWTGTIRMADGRVFSSDPALRSSGGTIQNAEPRPNAMLKLDD
eukprot:SAG22_NODE_24_length_30194_cov_6.086327_10_plen_813_part_00